MGRSERPRPLGLNCDLLWEMGALVINRADRLIHQTRYIRSDITVSLLGGLADFKAIFAIWHYMSSSPLLLQSVCFHELNSTTLSSSGEAAYCWVCTRQEFLRNMSRTQDYKVSTLQESVIVTHKFITMISKACYIFLCLTVSSEGHLLWKCFYCQININLSWQPIQHFKSLKIQNGAQIVLFGIRECNFWDLWLER